MDLLSVIKDEVWARLGEFTFKLKTLQPDKFERDTAYRWAKLDLIGRSPDHQFIGPDEEKITISGVLYPEFSGRLDHLKKLRDLATTGKPQRLIYSDTGIGQNLGLWIIRSIKESRSTFWGDGVPRKIEFSIELESYEAISAP